LGFIGAQVADWLGVSPETVQRMREGKMGPQLPSWLDPPSTQEVQERFTNPAFGPGYQPQTDVGRYAKAGTSGAVQAALSPNKAKAMWNMISGVGGGLGSEAGSDVAGYLTGNKSPETQDRADFWGRLVGSIFGAYGGSGKSNAQKTSERAIERGGQRGLTGDQLREQARPLYEQLDKAGVTYDQNQWKQMTGDLATSLKNEGFHPAIHPMSTAAMADLEKAGRGVYDRSVPPDLSLSRVQSARKLALAAYKSGSPEDRKMAGEILQKIDNFVDTVNPSGGLMTAPDVQQTWAQARDLWKRSAKTDIAENRLDTADLNAATANSGGNVENAIRQQVKAEMKKDMKPGVLQRFSDNELRNMEAIAKGTDMQNRLRGFGNTYGGSGAVRLLQHGGTGSLLQSAALANALDSPMTAIGLAGAGVGSALLRKAGTEARAASTRMAENQADRWLKSVSTGADLPPITQTQQLADLLSGPPTRDKLAVMMQLGLISGGQVKTRPGGTVR
jgi:hypothetical protein